MVTAAGEPLRGLGRWVTLSDLQCDEPDARSSPGRGTPTAGTACYDRLVRVRRHPARPGEDPHAGRTGPPAKERVDRELIELLNGLRVALPGVQVLFAFLLTVPFAPGFADVDAFQRRASMVCLLGPPSPRASMLAVAMVPALLLVVDVLTTRGAAWTAATAALVLLLWLWLLEPLQRRRRQESA